MSRKRTEFARRGGHLAALAALCLLGYAPSAAADRAAQFPDPGGSESATLELGAISPKLAGANDDFPTSTASHEASIGKLARAGLGAVRRTLSWRSLEPLPGVWDEARWAEAESFYRTALANGMEPVMILGFAPLWAWQPEDQLACPTGGCVRPPAVAMEDAWAAFAAEAARRFPEATFEAWNEPNTVEFWGSSPDPERWARLLRRAYSAIEAESPQARVIACGCAGITAMSAETGGMEAGDFLRRALAAPEPISGHFDAISLHFFPQAYWPFIPFEFGAGSHLAELLSDVRSALAAAGQPPAKLWFDEIGFWTADPAAPQYAVSEQEAAAGVAKLLRRLITMKDVEAVLVHRAIDAAVTDPANPYQVRNSTFGLMRRTSSLEAKPSYCALAGMYEDWDRSDPGCDGFEPADLSPPPEPTPDPEPDPAPPLATDDPGEDPPARETTSSPVLRFQEALQRRSRRHRPALHRTLAPRFRVRHGAEGDLVVKVKRARGGAWSKAKISRRGRVLTGRVRLPARKGSYLLRARWHGGDGWRGQTRCASVRTLKASRRQLASRWVRRPARAQSC